MAGVQAVHGVRYQVRDVARSVAFYTTHLGFMLEHQQLPAFASVSLGEDLAAFIAVLKEAGLHFRNNMETGPGGRPIQIEDPDGNPIELFEPAR
jgi:glyoxylase I family protein